MASCYPLSYNPAMAGIDERESYYEQWPQRRPTTYPPRFHVPRSLEDRLRAKYLAYRGVREAPDHQWAALLQYLAREGILETPQAQILTPRTDWPKLFNVRLSPRYGIETDGRTHEFGGFGAALNYTDALSKAVGETLERTLFSRYQRNAMAHISARELTAQKKRHLDLLSIAATSTTQRERFPKLSWNDDTPFYWVPAHRWGEQHTTLIPAQMVFWNYIHGDEKVLTHPTTSGGACGFTYEEAVLGALLELIERDGFLIYWLNTITPPKVALHEVTDETFHTLQRALDRYQLETHYLDTTSDLGIPTVTCVLIDHSNGVPKIALGGAAGFSRDDLLIKSTLEALVVGSSLLSSTPTHLPDSYEPFSNTSTNRHLTMWQGTAMYERMKFLTRGTVRPMDTHASNAWGATQALPHVMRTLTKRGDGYQPYIYKIEHTVPRQLGVHLVRAIVPQLIPLIFADYATPLAAARLYEVPRALGYEPAPTLNPWPHPFP